MNIKLKIYDFLRLDLLFLLGNILLVGFLFFLAQRCLISAFVNSLAVLGVDLDILFLGLQ